MKISIHSTAQEADKVAADKLAQWLSLSTTRNVMLATGNTPIEAYRLVTQKKLSLPQVKVFALDEYVGVPENHAKNSANLLRRLAIEPWGVKEFFHVNSLEAKAAESIKAHESLVVAAGGIDLLVLGLGQNGHLAFNEPGSNEDAPGRVVDLTPISVEANRKWFDGEFAPDQGATVGMTTILAAKHILLLAYGSHKAAAVKEMIEGPVTPACPASFLQRHPDTELFLDAEAASRLTSAR